MYLFMFYKIDVIESAVIYNDAALYSKNSIF